MGEAFQLDHGPLARAERYAALAAALGAQTQIDSRASFNEYCRRACRLWKEHFDASDEPPRFTELLARIGRGGDAIISTAWGGVIVTLHQHPHVEKYLVVRRGGYEQRVAAPVHALLIPAAPELRGPALERWYRRSAREEFLPRLERACAELGRPPAPLTVRGQRTRWGSCSSSGAISLNWRLLLAPEAVLDYVVWHEVCHLQQMNHSADFWALVAAHCPRYRTHAGWLRQNGSSLIL